MYKVHLGSTLIVFPFSLASLLLLFFQSTRRRRQRQRGREVLGSMGLVLLFVFFFICQAFVRLQIVCGNAELKVLMEMKGSLDPENQFLSSWMEDGDPCSGSFEGVACNEHGKVANISLVGRGLSGSVPPSVSGLKCLSGLYLHYNLLKGEIPKEISYLSELSDLYLNVNNLSGRIPAELGNMGSLQGKIKEKKKI